MIYYISYFKYERQKLNIVSRKLSECSVHWSPDFQKFWKAKLGRKEININVAHSRVMHGNGALSFERKYDFAWQEEPSKSSLGDLPTPASSAFSVQEPSKSSTPASPVQVPKEVDDDLFKPLYGNKMPKNSKGEEGPAHYKRVEPLLYKGHMKGHIAQLYRENSGDITSAQVD